MVGLEALAWPHHAIKPGCLRKNASTSQSRRRPDDEKRKRGRLVLMQLMMYNRTVAHFSPFPWLVYVQMCQCRRTQISTVKPFYMRFV
jgi:adenine-specific DNA glycosylase